ncbi:hypothetical protein ACHAXT_011549 [Thalassiosira profunda]
MAGTIGGATMPSSTGRHILHRNLRETNDLNGDGERDAFDDNPVENGTSGRYTNRPDGGSAEGGNSGDFDDEKPPRAKPPRRLSSSLMHALEDSNSELAHFLLSKNDNDDERGLFGRSQILQGARDMTSRFVTGEDQVNEVGPLGTNKAWFYSLALEPMEVRRDRIIMLAEAYAIFGALFLSGTWVLYEWGSGYGYGGCRWEDTEYCHPAVDRAFEVVMAMAITANIFQAMFASFLWLMSIMYSGSHRNWVFGVRNLLQFNHLLLTAVFVLTILGVGLGIYAKLAPYWPELAIALAFLLVVVLYGIATVAFVAAEEISLEYYHFPLWFKWSMLPYPMLRRGGRQRIREAAEVRAKELRARAYREREMMKPHASTSRRNCLTSVGILLRSAADGIGRRDFDVSKYEERLEADWYSDADELKGMSIDTLSKYMPRRLAEEVYSLARLPASQLVPGRSIASGVLPGPKERQVSWNLDVDTE